MLPFHLNLLYRQQFHNLQQQRFNQMSTSIIGRIDEMGNRIDDLEKSIGDLMQQVVIDRLATSRRLKFH